MKITLENEKVIDVTTFDGLDDPHGIAEIDRHGHLRR